MARTPLLSNIARLARVARAANRSGIPAAELLDFSRSRRRFLQASAGAAALSLAACATTPDSEPTTGAKPSVAIVGGGIAGLHCAHVLRKSGITADIYEASDRTGGRIWSRTGLFHSGQSVEIGGSFIDSGHKDMFDLCREFKLPLIDMADDAGPTETAYYFGGRHYSDREVLEALQPFVARMTKDAEWLEKDWDALQSDKVVRALDNTGIAAYLSDIGVSGWLKALLEVAFVTEYGLDADEQSCFNMLSLIGLDTSAGRWEAFGESDERYCIKGGNQRVVDSLARRHEDHIRTGWRLARVSGGEDGYTLAFEGRSREVRADIVVLALPFTLLREVEMKLDLPEEKRLAIAELGYGTNAKLIIGTSARPWRVAGYAGGIFSDEAFQLAWEDSRRQAGEGGAITMYSGGKPGVDVGEGAPNAQVERMLPGLNKAFPGMQEAFNGKSFRMHWPSYAYAKASYACYRPGQWTTIAGHEITPVGNLLFAGEHCSDAWQGFMNGGAETGRMAAEAILAAVTQGAG
jgi:monoamine oxidase